MSEFRLQWAAWPSRFQRQLVISFFSMLVALACCLTGCKREAQPIENSSRSVPREADKLALSTPATQFELRAVSALMNCDYHNGSEANYKCMLEIVGGGAGCLDFDADGIVDLFFPRGGRIEPTKKETTGVASALLRGLGKWEFTHCDVQARIDTTTLYTHGTASVDYDQDGLPDLLVYGYGGILLFHNLGDGTFENVTSPAGLENIQWTTAAAWLDIDNDQSLDMYLGSYLDWGFDKHVECKTPEGNPDVCSPNAFAGTQNVAYTNNNDGTFSQVLDEFHTPQLGKTLSVLAATFAAGERTSLYVTNDLVANFLFIPQGSTVASTSTRYSEVAFASGVAVDDQGLVNASMGVSLLDFDADRKFDIFVTNFEHERMALYHNVGESSFHHISREAGLNRTDLRVVGFGIVAADFDGDADEDIAYTAGHVHYEPDSGTMEQQAGYLQNEAGQRLKKTISPGAFFTNLAVGRGLATADLDNDGDLDLVATQLLGPPTLSENMLSSAPHWLAIDLVGVTAPRTPIGTVVEVTTGKANTATQRTQIRQLYSGGSYLSQCQSTLFFSWPRPASERKAETETAAEVVVHWPDGRDSAPMKIESNQHITLIQQTQP
ncbi:MAG: CRTAC1 family protein [Pirellulaceae bacterium]